MKFPPKKPFHLYEEGSFQGNPGRYTKFVSDLVRVQIAQGGVPVRVYRYIGTPDQKRGADGLKHDTMDSTKPGLDVKSYMTVQDHIIGENRDRLYNFDDVPVLWGVYQISQFELQYMKFGGMMSNDTITLEFHVGDMEKECGRRLIMGDVIELEHLRDVSVSGRVMSRYYEVEKLNWSPTGYDATWGRHIMGVLVRPLKNTQEFIEFFEREDEYGRKMAEQSNKDALMAMTGANQAMAMTHASTTGFDTSLMWYDPDQPNVLPNLFTDDAIPPDGAINVPQGMAFPPNPNNGDWFVRIDIVPNRLYRYKDAHWISVEVDRKREWGVYGWIEPLTGYMSDRSEEHKARNYKLVSIHDAATNRQELSDPTYGGDKRSQR